MLVKTGFPRLLAPEILDGLDEHDPRAIRSRKDLKRINWVMGSSGILASALNGTAAAPKRIIELGAGDGSLMLRLAGRLACKWPGVHVVLLDRQNVVDQQTQAGLSAAGWTLEIIHADIENWIAHGQAQRFDIAIANLFIHHFEACAIGRLFDALGTRADMFAACEPRRGWLPLTGSRLVSLIGANDVTRTDAVLSVKAGFRDSELSAIWAASLSGWNLCEQPAGLFSHLFVARRCA